MEGIRILVVDDDVFVCRAVGRVLEHSGAAVITAQSGREAVRLLYSERPDLVLLDIRMPDMNGWEVLERIRELSSVPVVLLTALADEETEIRSLEQGAADYLRKPFSARVLIARVQAALRCALEPVDQAPGPDYRDNFLLVDLESRRVFAGGEHVRLTPLEFRMLRILVKNAGRVITKHQLSNYLWGDSYEGSDDNTRVHISNLRRKLEPDPVKPRYIVTEYGAGYRFERQQTVQGRT